MGHRIEATGLRSQYSSQNTFIQWISRRFCNWGKKRLTYNRDNNVLGSSAPLWHNPSATFYKVFFILNIISSVLFVIFFVVLAVYNANEKSKLTNSSSTNDSTDPMTNSTTVTDQKELECLEKIEKQLNPNFIIIGSVILLLNGKNKLLKDMI
jgi:hypothetical protein